MSDLHLSELPPRARAESESEWVTATGAALKELGQVAARLRARVFIAGDVFDKWDCSVQLVNRAIKWFKTYFKYKPLVIPGQHDLPEHNVKEIMRSPYYSLVLSGVIRDITDPKKLWAQGQRVIVLPFRWGQPLTRLELKQREPNTTYIALCHKYIWEGENKIAQLATEENCVVGLHRQLGYVAASVFGDNHKPFLYYNTLNCGTFMRRHQDDKPNWPHFGVMFNDGQLNRFPFKFPLNDRFNTKIEVRAAEDTATGEMTQRLVKIVQEIKKNNAQPEFKKIVFQAMEKEELSSDVKKFLYKLLEDL